MRGEHAVAALARAQTQGSSPLARGALGDDADVVAADGIIPACAGSTCYRCRLSASSWDHPRLRGEHTRPCASMSSASGSSPLARGARLIKESTILCKGIIPACAGSTLRRVLWLYANWDHPRLRGEHSPTSQLTPTRAGSSPLARGAPRRADGARHVEGIIPACAGSTPSVRATYPICKDHPRLRGEHTCWRGLVRYG